MNSQELLKLHAEFYLSELGLGFLDCYDICSFARTIRFDLKTLGGAIRSHLDRPFKTRVMLFSGAPGHISAPISFIADLDAVAPTGRLAGEQAANEGRRRIAVG